MPRLAPPINWQRLGRDSHLLWTHQAFIENDSEAVTGLATPNLWNGVIANEWNPLRVAESSFNRCVKMPKNFTWSLLAALVLLNSAWQPAQAQDNSQVDRINKWFEKNEEGEKKRDEYWKKIRTGPLQTPGKMQQAGKIQQAGQIQIPQGWKAIKTQDLPCQKRFAVSGDTLFEFDKDTLTPQAVATLNLLVPELKKQASHPVTVEGHTDSIGTDEYNVMLSNHRATRVKNWLIDNNIFAKDAVKVMARGKRVPVAPNTNSDGSDNPQGRQLNRRVEIVINTCVTLDKPVDDVATTEKTDTTASADRGQTSPATVTSATTSSTPTTDNTAAAGDEAQSPTGGEKSD